MWSSPFNRDEYTALARRLPRAQAEALAQLDRLDLVPLDIRSGETSPRISYVRASASPTGLYAGVSGLEYLDLYAYNLLGQDLRPIANSGITCLTLGGHGATDAVLQNLVHPTGALPRLVHLDLWADKTNADALTLGAVRSLRKRTPPLLSLQLSGSGITDEWLGALRELEHLRGVRLYETSVTEAGMEALAMMPNLRWLALREHEGLTVASVRTLVTSGQLRELQLCEGAIRDEMLQAIASDSRIETVVLINTYNVTLEGIRALLRCQSLRVVVFDFPSVEIWKELGAWRDVDPEQRHLFTYSDLYFGGWVSEPRILWLHDRVLNPMFYP